MAARTNGVSAPGMRARRSLGIFRVLIAALEVIARYPSFQAGARAASTEQSQDSWAPLLKLLA